MRAITYARKSNTDTRNPGKSVRDQQREARTEVERRGWTLIDELKDDGIGASRHSRKRERPGFDALLDLIATRKVDAVVLPEQSRATRRLSILGALLEECADAGVLLVIDGREMDPSNAGDLLQLGVQGAVDVAEVERTRERVERGMRGSAAAGRPHGRPVFGYTRIYSPSSRELLRVDVQPQQAAIVRRIAEHLLTGGTVRSITLALNAEGVPNPTGRAWHPSSVRRMIVSPTYAGRRVHRGAVVGDGDWPAILTLDEHLALVAAMTAPGRASKRPSVRKHLCSGLARCSECEGPLRVVLDRRRPTYACATPGCYRVTVGKESLDAFVSEALRARLARPDVVAALGRGDIATVQAARDALDDLDARRADVLAMLADGTLRRAEATPILKSIDAERRDADARALAAVGSRELLDLDVNRLDAPTLARVAPLVLSRVVVRRSAQVRGHNRFDASRVTFEWIGAD